MEAKSADQLKKDVASRSGGKIEGKESDKATLARVGSEKLKSVLSKEGSKMTLAREGSEPSIRSKVTIVGSEAGDLERKNSMGSDMSDAESDSGSTTEKDKRRKSSYGFDEYKFEATVLAEDDDAETRAEEDAAEDANVFIEMARLKNTEYSKIDLIHMASGTAGLTLDDTMVEPILIPGDETGRDEAVRALYGPDMKPDSEPVKDPITALEEEEEEKSSADKIHSPPNLYEALQSNFLKTNYKTSMYRLFLLGTHDENLGQLIEYHKDLIDSLNTQSYTEQLQGVLCVYEYYYIHVVEGSEDNLTKLMQRVARDLEPSGYEWDLKFHMKSERYTAKEHVKFRTVQTYVLGIFRIYERQFSIWRGEKVFPNKMHREDVPKGGFRERYFHFIRQCMVMVFTYNKMQATGFTIPDTGEEMTHQTRKAIERAKIQRFKSLGKVVTPITFIQYILENKNNPKLRIRPIREHLELFGGTPPYVSSSNLEWPPPGRIASYD